MKTMAKRCLVFPFWEDSFFVRDYYEKWLFFSSDHPRRNLYLKAADSVNHEKLNESWKTRWIMKNSMNHEKLNFLRRNHIWFMKNSLIYELSLIDEKLIDDFLIKKNHADL